MGLLDQLLLNRRLVLVGVKGRLLAVVGRRVVGRHGPQLPVGLGWDTGERAGALCR